MIKPSCSAALFLALAACGGGTATPDPEADTGPDPITFEIFTDGQAIASEIEAANTALGLMNPADLLNNGSATYQGTAEISSTAGLNAIGVMNMRVVFETGIETVSGSAGDFVDQEDNPIAGTLAIVGGSFNRNGSAGADLTASLAGDFDNLRFFILPQSQISGGFYGEAEGIVLMGDVDGLVDGAPTTYDIAIITEATGE